MKDSPRNRNVGECRKLIPEATIPGVFRCNLPSNYAAASACERLDAIIDLKHPLVRLAELVPWSDFDAAFGRFYKPVGRPAKATRLMVGLHYLKHSYDLSDEETIERAIRQRNGAPLR